LEIYKHKADIMRYYKQYGHFGILSDIIAIEQDIEGNQFPLEINDFNGILVCHKNTYENYIREGGIRVVGSNLPFRIVPKGVFDYGLSMAKKIGNLDLNNKSKIELEKLTEDESKVVHCTYGVTKIDGKDLVVINLGKYKPDQLFQATDWSDEIGDFFNYNPLYDEEFSYKDRIVISHESFINRIRLT